MFRLLGFIIGSAVSIGGILLVLGVPDFHLSSFETDQARFDAAVQKIREKQTPAESAAPVSVEDSPVSAEQATRDLIDNIETQLAADVDSDNAHDEESNMGPPHEELPAPPAGEAAVAEELAGVRELVSAEQQWQDFWNPFRSEIAARGFVSQLERVTGLDYRIVKVKAGEYQVGFAYQDDNDRQINIQQISAATGLELPEI